FLPFVEQVVDDVHLPAHTPLRKHRTATQVDDLSVRFIKPDVEVLYHRVPEPGDVVRGTGEQLVVRTDPVLAHEPGEVAACYPLLTWLPDNLLAEGKRLLHESTAVLIVHTTIVECSGFVRTSKDVNCNEPVKTCLLQHQIERFVERADTRHLQLFGHHDPFEAVGRNDRSLESEFRGLLQSGFDAADRSHLTAQPDLPDQHRPGVRRDVAE